MFGPDLEHDPKKCVAVFRKDHAQPKTWRAMAIQPNPIALQTLAGESKPGANE
jgi:hypothetical protein